ncbi:MAG: GNAT family N-acetyltransferase [Candidatus Heimdallarchaeota archaeon]|nr:GNAT family N-acetyltransferase [Candidatus Heimdallarchaeota archaeon]
MNTDLSQLYRLRKKDVKTASEVFLRAFVKDPLLLHMFPDEKSQKKYMLEYFRSRINYGFFYGEIYATSPNIEGLAIWFQSDKFVVTNWKVLRSGGLKLLFSVDMKTIKRVLDLGDFTNEFKHKHIHFPYWYLAPVGVDPQHQGKGLCSKLLKPMLTRCDKEGIPTVLETQLEKNVEIYKRYGYETIAETTIPESNLPHYLMVRHPRT